MTVARYQPFYCEENVWHLLREPRLRELPRWAVFISNDVGRCAVWMQRLAPVGTPVVWDYHVVALVWDGGALVWDLDSRLPLPCPLEEYLERSFPPELRARTREPRFRIVAADELERTFSSDRRHMRDPEGGWREPPPTWAPPSAPGREHNLDRFIDMSDEVAGDVLGLSELAELAVRTRRPAAVR